MSDPTPLARVSDPEVPARATRRHDSARYKAQVLLELSDGTYIDESRSGHDERPVRCG